MTRQEAAEVLEELKKPGRLTILAPGGVYDAIKMAIDALGKDKDVHSKDGDMISRQAAIDAAHKNYDTILDFKSDGRTVADSFEDIINALPPAQHEIIRCKDCRFLIDEGDGYMCGNPKGWVVGTDACFGCVYAKRRIDAD